MMDAAGNINIFLLAEALDAKRRRYVAIKTDVYQQISNTSSNYIPMSMKVNEKRQVVCLESDLHQVTLFPPCDHDFFWIQHFYTSKVLLRHRGLCMVQFLGHVYRRKWTKSTSR